MCKGERNRVKTALRNGIIRTFYDRARAEGGYKVDFVMLRHALGETGPNRVNRYNPERGSRRDRRQAVYRENKGATKIAVPRFLNCPEGLGFAHSGVAACRR